MRERYHEQCPPGRYIVDGNMRIYICGCGKVRGQTLLQERAREGSNPQPAISTNGRSAS